MKQLSRLTTEQLADGICLRAGRIAAAEAELLAWIAEFDRREGWAGPGMLSCAHWLSWRTGLSPNAARETVRVARRLEELPELAGAFAAGRVSYSKARAITRVARVDDGVDWVGLARHSSAAQLERVVRGCRRVESVEEAATDPELAQWKVRTRERYDRDGNLVITIVTRPEYAPVIKAGLEARRAELDRSAACGGAVSAGTPDEERATEGDALLALAQDALTAEQQAHPDVARRRRPQLTPQIDPVSGWARQADGELLPPSTMKQVLRSLPGQSQLRLRVLTPDDVRRHDLGRSRREVSPALREVLGTLDGERCRFPGCTRHRKLHAHHVVYWSDGGPTDLANLVLVCARHHTLIHQHGFQLLLHPDRRLSVSTSDGLPVLHHPAPPWGAPAELAHGCGQAVSAETLPPDQCNGRMDLAYVVSVLLAQAA